MQYPTNQQLSSAAILCAALYCSLLCNSCKTTQTRSSSPCDSSRRDTLRDYHRDNIYNLETRFLQDIGLCIPLPPAVWNRARFTPGYFTSALHQIRRGRAFDLSEDLFQAHLAIYRLSPSAIDRRQQRLTELRLERSNVQEASLAQSLDLWIFKEDFHFKAATFESHNRTYYRLHYRLPNDAIVQISIDYDDIMTPCSGRYYGKYDNPAVQHILDNISLPTAELSCNDVEALSRPPLLLNLRE